MPISIRIRARTLVAGLSVFLAGATVGCQDTQKNPLSRGPSANQNIPKTNVNAGFPSSGSSGGTSSSAGTSSGRMGGNVPITRESGNPTDPMAARVGMSQGAVGGLPASNGSPPYLNAPPAGGAGTITGVQPIATNNGATGRGILPANYVAPGTGGPANLPDLDPPPSGQNLARAKELPPVQPITTQDMYQKRNWEKKSPAMPTDLPAIPVSSQLPTGRTPEPLAPLGPPS